MMTPEPTPTLLSILTTEGAAAAAALVVTASRAVSETAAGRVAVAGTEAWTAETAPATARETSRPSAGSTANFWRNRDVMVTFPPQMPGRDDRGRMEPWSRRSLSIRLHHHARIRCFTRYATRDRRSRLSL